MNNGEEWDDHGIYPLVMTVTVRHGIKPWPSEIDGLPNLKMGGFSMANC